MRNTVDNKKQLNFRTKNSNNSMSAPLNLMLPKLNKIIAYVSRYGFLLVRAFLESRLIRYTNKRILHLYDIKYNTTLMYIITDELIMPDSPGWFGNPGKHP